MLRQLLGFPRHWQFIHSLSSSSTVIHQVKSFLVGHFKRALSVGILSTLFFIFYPLPSLKKWKYLEIACVDWFWKLALEIFHIKFFSAQTMGHRTELSCEFWCLHLERFVNVENKYDSSILGSGCGPKKIVNLQGHFTMGAWTEMSV